MTTQVAENTFVSPAEEASAKRLAPSVLDGLEWYDNSKLEKIDQCHRKAFWNLLFTLPGQEDSGRSGIELRVGPGARFGSCMHKAKEVYYSLIRFDYSEQKRRIAAIRAFCSEHDKLFPLGEKIEPKHEKENGCCLFDLYCDHFAADNRHYKVIEPELFVMVKVEPRGTEPWFESFIYCGRIDMVVERVAYGDLLNWESKHISSGLDREQKRREVDRQSEGYLFLTREFEDPKRPIIGVIWDLMLVSASETDPEKLFRRPITTLSHERSDAFRRETIMKVQRWRNIKADATLSSTILEAIEAFDRRTEECTNYGLCPYYELCKDGIHAVNWSNYSPNRWDPSK